MKTEKIFERVRELCLSLPETSEKLSHGEPTFFARKRVFVMYSANHHGDLRYALWCNVPEGAQEALIRSDPKNFFFPPYVGKAGWVGMRIDRGLPWRVVSSVVKDAYDATLARQSRSRSSTRGGR